MDGLADALINRNGHRCSNKFLLYQRSADASADCTLCTVVLMYSLVHHVCSLHEEHYINILAEISFLWIVDMHLFESIHRLIITSLMLRHLRLTFQRWSSVRKYHYSHQEVADVGSQITLDCIQGSRCPQNHNSAMVSEL